MHSRRNDILTAVFQTRGHAFRILGRSSGCPEMDDMTRQFIAEDVRSLSWTALKKLRADAALGTAVTEKCNGLYGAEFHLVPIRHAVWRKMNRSVTRINRLCDRWLTG